MPDPRTQILAAQTAVASALDEAGDGSYAWTANPADTKAPWVLEALMDAGWEVRQRPAGGYNSPSLDDAIGYALLESDHLPGFAARGPAFRRLLAERGFRIIPNRAHESIH